MKVVLSSLVALSFFSAGAAFAHTRAPALSDVSSAAFVSDQARQPSSHNVPLYHLKSEDVSSARYWTTPKALGGGLESGRGAAVLAR